MAKVQQIRSQQKNKAIYHSKAAAFAAEQQQILFRALQLRGRIEHYAKLGGWKRNFPSQISSPYRPEPPISFQYPGSSQRQLRFIYLFFPPTHLRGEMEDLT
ncbi:hypothetical protein CDAR_503191 [Caerostris darwini]|uniref:Uncharacterized protein n=1 Tax=Caerostris darwini TaxID=1538125 RepID=A0AAV4VLS7_9ARAC|nr:hypothetical protein CDAR_503191 [Caerostris darwini]